MADEIRQDLGFDAAQALDTISKLNTGFESLFQTLGVAPRTFDAFNQRAGKTVSALIQIQSQVKQTVAALNTVGGTAPVATAAAGLGTSTQAAQAEALAGALAQSTAAANVAGQAHENLGDKATKAFTRSTRSASGFAISLETITRVISTQLIVRALSQIQRAIEQSFNSFIQFENALATIRTILPDSFASLEKELVGLSNAFNVPLLDVVEAKYQIVQNGFESAAESTAILTAALKFARITNTDAAASADLISSSLNAYSQSASEAEVVTAKLVRTIDIGRISGTELVNAFGRVAPIGKEIGATTDELLAAFSSISIGGVRASEAATQIRATLTALLKPSEDMKVAFRELGIQTGDQAIQTFGLHGALQRLIGTTNGSTAAIAKLFPNVRALNGVLRTTGSGAQVLEEHLAQIRATATEVLNRKYSVRVESNAERVTADLNKLKNFLTTEVGKSLVDTAGSSLKFAGGIDAIINASRAFLPAIAVATAALVTYGITAASAAGFQQVFNRSVQQSLTPMRLFSGALATVVAGYAAFQTGKFLGSQITDFFNAERDKRERDAKEKLQFESEQNAAIVQLSALAARDRVQAALTTAATLRRAYFQEVDSARDANEALLSNNKETLDRIIESRDKFAQDLKRAAADAEASVIDSRRASNNLIVKLEDERFNRENKKFNALTQIQNARNRADQISALARKQLLGANTDEEVRAARASADRAESFRTQALESAKTHGSVSLIRQLEQEQELSAEKRIATELKFQQIRAQDAQKLRLAAAEEEKTASRIKILSRDFLDNARLFDSAGNPLSKDQLTENAEKAKQALTELRELAFDGTHKFSIGDIVSFDSLERRLEQSVTQAEVQSLFASDDSLDALVDQIQNSIGKEKYLIDVAINKFGVDADRFENLTREEVFNEFPNVATESEETLAKQETSAAERKRLEGQILQAQKAGAKSFEASLTKGEFFIKALQLGQRNFLFGGDATPAKEEQASINSLRQTIRQGLDNPDLTKEFVRNLEKSLKDFSEQASVFVNLDVEDARFELEKLKLVQQSQAEIKSLETGGFTEESLQRSREQLGVRKEDLGVQQEATKSSQAARKATLDTSNASITWATQARDVASASVTIAANFASAAGSMAGLTNAGVSPPVNRTASVISTQSPRQITAAQSQQVGQGVNVGGVTVNVTTSSTNGDLLGRQIAAALQREIRRGSAQLRA
jgi:TP901 family phage tail tape measure protein